MVARFNLNVDQSIQMDGTMKVVWYPSREGEWVRYTDYADRIAELKAELAKAKLSNHGMHKTIERLTAPAPDDLAREELEAELRWWKKTALIQNAGLSPTAYKELKEQSDE